MRNLCNPVTEDPVTSKAILDALRTMSGKDHQRAVWLDGSTATGNCLATRSPWAPSPGSIPANL